MQFGVIGNITKELSKVQFGKTQCSSTVCEPLVRILRGITSPLSCEDDGYFAPATGITVPLLNGAATLCPYIESAIMNLFCGVTSLLPNNLIAAL